MQLLPKNAFVWNSSNHRTFDAAACTLDSDYRIQLKTVVLTLPRECWQNTRVINVGLHKHPIVVVVVTSLCG
jgi:hypothetical protein